MYIRNLFSKVWSIMYVVSWHLHARQPEEEFCHLIILLLFCHLSVPLLITEKGKFFSKSIMTTLELRRKLEKSRLFVSNVRSLTGIFVAVSGLFPGHPKMFIYDLKGT